MSVNQGSFDRRKASSPNSVQSERCHGQAELSGGGSSLDYWQRLEQPNGLSGSQDNYGLDAVDPL